MSLVTTGYIIIGYCPLQLLPYLYLPVPSTAFRMAIESLDSRRTRTRIEQLTAALVLVKAINGLQSFYGSTNRYVTSFTYPKPT